MNLVKQTTVILIKEITNSLVDIKYNKCIQKAAAKYIPSSLQEIQHGTELDCAKYSKVSFDPDADYLSEELIDDLDRFDRGEENSEFDTSPDQDGGGGTTSNEEQKSVHRCTKNMCKYLAKMSNSALNRTEI